MSFQESSTTTRRRLDYRQRGAPEASGQPRVISRSNSSSFTDHTSILDSAAVKQSVDFFASAATIPQETKTQQQVDDEARIQEVREIIAHGVPQENQKEYAAVIRDTLSRRAKQLLKSDLWIFEPEQIEEQV